MPPRVPDHQVRLADRVGEALPHAYPHVLHADEERDAEGDGADGEGRGQKTVPEGLDGQVEDQHQAALPTRFTSGSDKCVENRSARDLSWLTKTRVAPTRSTSRKRSFRKASRRS